HLAAFRLKAAKSLDRLEAEADNPSGALSIGDIAVGCALAHLDFRFSTDDWRAGRTNLAAWHADFSRRPSVCATEFADIYCRVTCYPSKDDTRRRMIKVPQQQIPGVYHRRVGDIVVTAISDGFLDGTLDVLRNITQDEARQILAESFRPARRTAVNAFLVYSAGRLALIETGSGNYLQPTAGKVMANLKTAGVDPADIEAVLLTPMHPDHSARPTEMATGQRNFPHAAPVLPH